MLVWFKLMQSEIFFSPQANFTKFYKKVRPCSNILWKVFVQSLAPASFIFGQQSFLYSFLAADSALVALHAWQGSAQKDILAFLEFPDFVWIIIQSHNHLNQFDFVLATDESQSCLQEIFLLKDNCSDQRGRAVNIIMIEILTTERTWYILSGKSYKCFLKV